MRLVLLGLAQFGMLAAILIFADLGDPTAQPVWVWIAVAVAFLFAESTQLHIESRRQMWTLSLSEIPIIVGLFLLGPVGTMLMRLVAVGALWVRRRFPPVKAFFNAGMFSLEPLVAGLVLAGLHVPYSLENIGEPRTWAVALLAVLAADLGTVLMLTAAISATQGLLTGRQIGSIGLPIVGAAIPDTAIGLVVLVVVSANPEAGLLLLVVAGALFGAYRAYSKFLLQHRSLNQVYDFARVVEDSRASDGDFSGVLEALRDLMRAEHAALWLPAAREGDSPRLAVVSADTTLPYVGPGAVADPIRAKVLDEVQPLLVQSRSMPSRSMTDALGSRGVSEVLAVPLTSGQSVLGYVEVADRRGETLFFGEADRQLLISLATHVSASVENLRLVDQLRYEASHDRLTGLPNRAWLSATIDEYLSDGAGADEPLAVLVVDVDSFRDVNDTLGHVAGDELLAEVARHLRDVAPADALVARMGSDEFAVLLPGRDVNHAEEEAGALRAALSVPCQVAGLTVDVSVAIGLAVAPIHGVESGALLQRADVALYAARAESGSVASYLPSMDQSSLRRLHLGTQLREAMASGQIVASYQPMIGLQSSEVICVETLVRWQHPRYGVVTPDDFVPLAERIGLIGPLTMHVLRLAAHQCKAWLDRDLRIGISVNLSARSLADAGFCDAVLEVIAEAGIPPELLTFEITESSVMADPERALPVLHRLHGLGIGLAVDDFGTGYSSLAYLRKLPVDEVKIDKSFVLGMSTDLGDLAIARAIIELAHSLGLRVVAEGVEDELTRDLLAGMDCDVAQGFLVSRPLPPDRLDAWLMARTATRPAQPGVHGRRLYIPS